MASDQKEITPGFIYTKLNLLLPKRKQSFRNAYNPSGNNNYNNNNNNNRLYQRLGQNV